MLSEGLALTVIDFPPMFFCDIDEKNPSMASGIIDIKISCNKISVSNLACLNQ